ncbi:MAG: hypothetical protein RL301_108 [Actinomycetota bacterium]|jgi:serine/threonine protein phosphatase PrpC
MSLRFSASARSEVGLVRQKNEDSAVINGVFIAVADGMGGHVGGETASKIAINSAVQLLPLLNNDEIDPESLDDFLLNSILEIDSDIKDAISDNPELSGMGTTFVGLALYRNRVSVLHVGDSRAYRLRGKSFELLTRDHTVVQDLLDQGAINEKEIATHPQRAMLTQALVGDGKIIPVLIEHEVKEHDKYLLCSDGLSNFVAKSDIEAALNGKDSVNTLIELAYKNGAPDNVTVIVAEVGSGDTETKFFGAAK